MTSQTHEQPGRGLAVSEGPRHSQTQTREEADRGMRVLDEKEARDRLLQAFDEYLKLGLQASLIGVNHRDHVEYSLELSGDGADEVPLRQVMALADQYRLDLFHDRERGLCLYARF